MSPLRKVYRSGKSLQSGAKLKLIVGIADSRAERDVRVYNTEGQADRKVRIVIAGHADVSVWILIAVWAGGRFISQVRTSRLLW